MTQNATLPLLDPPGPTLDAAIDFLNTTGLTDGRPFEELDTVRAALHWFVDRGFLSAAEAHAEMDRLAGGAEEEALSRVRDVRAGLRELVDSAAARHAPTGACLTAVNSVLCLRETTELVPSPTGLRITRRREGYPLDRALAEVSRRIAGEFDEGRHDRFRVCANDRCRWAFYDRSRPGSRRWCEMSSCGNRAKAARHRARRRASAGAATSSGGTPSGG